MSAVYRVRQGLRALFAFARPIEADAARTWLTPDELALFNRLQRGERLHCLNVLGALLAQHGRTPRALAAAALLHDVGKIRYPLHLWQKTLVVLARTFVPPLYHRLAAANPEGWLARPFVVYERHPAWSAEYAAQAGSNDDTIWLCAHHADPAGQWRDHPLYPLLVRLQQADDTN